MDLPARSVILAKRQLWLLPLLLPLPVPWLSKLAWMPSKPHLIWARLFQKSMFYLAKQQKTLRNLPMARPHR